ncbi:MAG: hypothetical protein NW216_12335 [Hyphomicrobium sp.]|nr:hypothetical protein [Hyphomicrobium sp.]
MDHVPNDILMAFVDGELSDEQRTWLEARLARDPDLRSRLEPFAVTRATLPLIFDQPAREPVPQHLIALIQNGGRSATAATRSDRVVERGTGSVPSRHRPLTTEADQSGWFDRLFGGFALAPALGYAAVLLVGAGVGWIGASTLGGGDGDIVRYESGGLVASRGLLEALDQKPSGEALSADGRLITVTASFRSGDGRICRQYQVTAQAAPSFAGYACRNADGLWRVAMHTEAVSVATRDVAYGGDSGEARIVSPAVDAAVSGTMSGEPMAVGEEQELLRKRWSH